MTGPLFRCRRLSCTMPETDCLMRLRLAWLQSISGRQPVDVATVATYPENTWGYAHPECMRCDQGHEVASRYPGYFIPADAIQTMKKRRRRSQKRKQAIYASWIAKASK